MTSWLLFVMFIEILLLMGQVWYLVVSIPDPCYLSNLFSTDDQSRFCKCNQQTTLAGKEVIPLKVNHIQCIADINLFHFYHGL